MKYHYFQKARIFHRHQSSHLQLTFHITRREALPLLAPYALRWPCTRASHRAIASNFMAAGQSPGDILSVYRHWYSPNATGTFDGSWIFCRYSRRRERRDWLAKNYLAMAINAVPSHIEI